MELLAEASGEARSDKAVVFAIDDKYAKYALFAANQIARRNPGRDFDICLCSMFQELRLPAGLADLGLRTCRIETGTLFDGLRLDPGRTQAVYLRLALPSVFSATYRRLLYLDADIFVQAGDLSALMDVDMRGRFIAAVRDNMQWRTPNRRPEQFRRLGIPTAPYFNAGVLLIDVAGYNEADVLGQCVVLGREHAAVMIRHDQNLLNSTLRGHWAELHPAWNWQYTWASRLFEALEGANIVHFIGPTKPWRDPRGHLPPRFSRELAAFLAEHFPQDPPLEPAPRPHADRAYLRRMLLKHLLATGRFCDYLDRFDDELTVLV